jgi:hypothetical protein
LLTTPPVLGTTRDRSGLAGANTPVSRQISGANEATLIRQAFSVFRVGIQVRNPLRWARPKS